MIVNFRTRGIHRDARKVARTSILIKKKLLTILEQNVFGWKIKKAVADMDGKDEMMNPLV